MRLIDADELLIALPSPEMRVTKQLIEEAPTVDAEPVKHARWDGVGKVFSEDWTCSNCGHMKGKGSGINFCGNCGAKMDGRRR